MRKFDITAASSPVTAVIAIAKRRERESRVLGRDIRVGRSVGEREAKMLMLLWRREGRRGCRLVVIASTKQ